MKKVYARTRREWVEKLCGTGARCTIKRMGRVVRSQQRCERYTAMPANGSKFEKIAFVHRHDPRAPLIIQYNQGRRQFDRTVVDAAVGSPIDRLTGAIRLAKIGLAIARAATKQVELQATDPRVARYVNESRCGRLGKGYKAGQLIEAILHIHKPKRGHVNVSDDRRLRTAITLETEWAILCLDLLDDRSRVRLRSAWTFANPRWPQLPSEDSSTEHSQNHHGPQRD